MTRLILLNRSDHRKSIRSLTVESLEARQLLSCVPAAGALPCLESGGQLGDGLPSLSYDPQDGDLSLLSDRSVMMLLHITSENGLLRYPNDNQGLEISEATELLKLDGPFTDLIDVAAIPKGMSEFEVISDLRADASVLDAGPDGSFGTNDDFVRDLANIDLIYPIDTFDPEPDTPDGAIELSPLSPIVTDRALSDFGDEDWYRWTAPARGQLSVEAFFEHQIGDAELELYHEDELLSRSSTLNRNESVRHEVLAGEEYLIRIYGFQGARQSKYDLVAYLNPEELPVYVLRDSPVGDSLIDVVDPISLELLGPPIRLSEDFGTPTDIELGPNGLLYVAFDGGFQTFNSIVELTPQGIVTNRTSFGVGFPENLPSPRGFEVLEDGTFLIAKPNLQMISQITRDGYVENEFHTPGVRPNDATVVTGPQPLGTGIIQLPVAAEGPGQSSISPNAFGQYWVADTDRDLLRLFESDGTENLDFRIDATAARDVQESASRDIYSLEGNLLRRRSLNRQVDVGFFDDFDGIATSTGQFAGQGSSGPAIYSDGSNGFIRLTSLAQNNHFTYAYDEQPDQTGPEPNGFVMSFDFRMTDDDTNDLFGGCCGSAADGFGIGLFSTDTYGKEGRIHVPDKSPGVWERPSFQDAFTVGFDVFQNVDRVTLNWAGNEIAEAKLDGIIDLNDNTFHQAIVQVTPAGRQSLASVWIDDTQVLQGIEISEMQLASLFNYRVIAGGRTGSAYTETDLDNIAVNSIGMFEDFSEGSKNRYEFVRSGRGPEGFVVSRGREDVPFARLSTLKPNTNNAIAFDQVETQTGPARDGLLMSFDFRMTDDATNDEAGGCCGSAGEGIGIGIFDSRTYDRTGGVNPGENGKWEAPTFKSAFAVGFRVSGNSDVVTVSLGGEQVIERKVNRFVDLNDNQFHHATVKLTPNGEHATVNVWVDSQLVLSATLEDLILADLPDYRVIAGARTSNSLIEADIDNIAVASVGVRRTMEVAAARSLAVDSPVAIAVTDGERPVITPGDLVDTDGDGLYDEWEIQGIDANNDGTIDLVLPGADPYHKDLYVEIDSLAGFEPSPIALAKVRAAFAEVPNTLLFNPDGQDGIRLHTIVDESVVPSRDLMHLPSDVGELWKKFYAEIRTSYFGSPSERSGANAANVLAAKDLVYRYTFWGNERGTQGRSGIAEVPGRNLMITMGSWRTPGGTPDQQAAMFMHELGHTLGLGHGSGDHIAYKPNHLSVMNYSHSGGATVVNGETFLDYSRYAPNSPDPRFRNFNLDENELYENQGFGFPADVNFTFALGDNDLEVVDNSVDWNRNGILGEVVSRDLTKDRPGELLKTQNEWGSLIYKFRNYHDSGDGSFPDEEPTSDICDRYNADYSASGVDQFECNDEESEAYPHESDQPLPNDDEAAINGPGDEDWFTIENLNIDDLITILIAPLVPTDPAPSIDVVAYNEGTTDPLTAYTSVNGSAVTRTFAVDSAGDYSAKLTLSDPDAAYASYRLTISSAAPSDTFIWNGSVSSNWSDGGNWDGGIAPSPGQNVIIPVGSNQAVIDIDSDQLVNTLTIGRSVEFTAAPATSVGFVNGELYVAAGSTVTFGANIEFAGAVNQTGSGDVELYGAADTWTVAGTGQLIGYGSANELTVMPTASMSVGSVLVPFNVSGTFDLRGTFVADVQIYQLSKPDVSSVAVGNNVTVAGTSELEFEISLEPTPHQLSAVGVKTDSIFQAPTVSGSFGVAAANGTHIDAGIFLQSINNTGTSYDVSILHAVAGDSDGADGFGSGDLVTVFGAKQYEDGIVGNSTWVTGDWNHDSEFDTGDLVLAFQIGAYEQGAVAAVAMYGQVPVYDLEPNARTIRNDEQAARRKNRANLDNDNRKKAILQPQNVDSVFVP